MGNDGVVPLFRNLSPVLPKQLVARGSSNIHPSTTSNVVVSVKDEEECQIGVNDVRGGPHAQRASLAALRALAAR